jgi:hypothetical protein
MKFHTNGSYINFWSFVSILTRKMHIAPDVLEEKKIVDTLDDLLLRTAVIIL